MMEKLELPSQKDFAIAFKAIALMRGLSGDAKTIAAVILSHFNATTGQCDPGTDRLLDRAGVSKRTVVNATNELHARGLIAKIQHGGNGFRSRYQPNWAAFRQFVRLFEGVQNTDETVQEAAPTQCKTLHLDSAKSCTLTNNRNSHKKLTDTDGAVGNGQPKPSKPSAASENFERVKGLVRGGLRRSFVSHRRPLSVASAAAEASERLSQQIDKLSETMRTALAAVVDDTMRQRAVIEEQKRRGAGLPYLIDRASAAAWSPRTGSVVHHA